ncbi:hypothetical protein [Sphingomonas sanxanigenens]|uniref:Uncharacterized protein n=1 Tax=Sphingomonas sanxanigenens DSM 19645 = NX02 TaxID=1123269 RepID=W0A3Q7_9SPHN|nr:hypothetical protein [Sphingomonas sanxanigenens]AHE52574.1 hypothetical protein NX02_04120 [Sphingomonas sanxanigenens DSM 19645 = NX02]
MAWLLTRPWWALAIFVLLGVNLALALLILTDRTGRSPPTAASAGEGGGLEPRSAAHAPRGSGDVRPGCPRGALRRGGVIDVTIDDRGLGMLGVEAPDGRLVLLGSDLEHRSTDPDPAEAWRTGPFAIRRVGGHRRIYRIASGQLEDRRWEGSVRPLFDRPGTYVLRFAGNDPDAPDPWLRGSCAIRFVG